MSLKLELINSAEENIIELIELLDNEVYFLGFSDSDKERLIISYLVESLVYLGYSAELLGKKLEKP